ncbi:MAG: sulfatase [Candidatus Aenigmatarchaeota archaeon]
MNKNKILLLLIPLLFLIILSINNTLPKTQEDNLNIILITIEATRADHLPCYGYLRNTTPNICNLAEDGVLFENAYSLGSRTHISLPSFFTSSPPNVGIGKWDRGSLSKNYKTVAEALQKGGFECHAFISPGGISEGISKTNIDQGFNTSHKDIFNIDPRKFKNSSNFIWTHITTPHRPYTPDNNFRIYEDYQLNSTNLDEITYDSTMEDVDDVNKLMDLYDEELLMTDDDLKNFINKLKGVGLYNKSLIILTADHGEAFGEHNKIGHGMGIPYEEEVHVPLIIKFPSKRFAGKIIEKPVSHMDVVPTIYDFLNIFQKNCTGVSLLPLIKDKQKRVTTPVFSSQISKFWGMRIDNFKFYVDKMDFCYKKNSTKTNFYLYDIRKDQKEKNNIWISESSRDEELKQKICDFYLIGERNIHWKK